MSYNHTFHTCFSLGEIKWPPGGASASVLLLAANELKNDIAFFMVHIADLCLIFAFLSEVLETD